MKWSMLSLLFALLFFAHCGNDDEPLAGASLVGKWKMERIKFETESGKSELSLPTTYAVSLTISEDGTYTIVENGQEKKQTWSFDNGAQKLTVKNEDQSESTFDVTQSTDGLSWSYLATQIDLTKTLSTTDRQTVDFMTLVTLSQGKTMEGAKNLKIFFVMKKN
jgi:hypothetical protein